MPADNLPMVDRGDQSIDAYLLKLLTIIVARAPGQTIRIPIQDIYGIESQEGVVKSWDPKTKEIVLTYAPQHTEVYFNRPPETKRLPSPDSQSLLQDMPPLPPPRGVVEMERPKVDTNWAARRAAHLTHTLLTDENLAARERAKVQRDLEKGLTSPTEVRGDSLPPGALKR